MKIEVEQAPDSVSTLRIELPPEQVSKEWDAIAEGFARHAKIAGYRPGKAPRRVVEAKFKKEIEEEVTKKLIGQSYREAIAEKQLRVVSLTNLQDVEITSDKTMRFRATVITAPDFALPDYKAIAVEVPLPEVSVKEVDAAMERLRDQAADFIDVEPPRPLTMEDFAVIDFEGTVEGKAIAEVAPEASKNLQGGKKFWLRLAPGNFLPDFCEQIAGMNKDETRLVMVSFPDDFPAKELVGKKGDYAVTLRELKTKVLPELDDAFAAKLTKDKTLAEVRHMVLHDLEHEKEHNIEQAKEAQIVKALHEQTQFDLPSSLLRNETRRALGELVQRNRERGVPDDVLKTKEKELVEGAGSLAAHRLKTNFILHRIAEAEKISVASEDVEARLREQAAHYQMPVEKLRKESDEHDGMNGLVEEILLGKTLAFLKANVSVKTTETGDEKAVHPEGSHDH
ncbi:MAG: trigger factor [Verrucomicrobiota bacterium]|nr:trigger factor [Verrucomicrobiota bacterium]